MTDQVALAFENGEPERAEELALRIPGPRRHPHPGSADGRARDERRGGGLPAQIGTPRAIEDVAAILTVIKARHTLRLSDRGCRATSRCSTTACRRRRRRMIDAPSAGGPTLFVYKLVMMMSRLAAPWQLIRLAHAAAGSDNASRIAETPYAVTVDIVLAEIERMIRRIEGRAADRPRACGRRLLKSIHDAARGLRTEIDFRHRIAWGREACRACAAQVSDVLKGEIETLPGRVRRLSAPAADQGNRARIPRSTRTTCVTPRLRSSSSTPVAPMRASLR